MLPTVTLRQVSRDDVDRVGGWLQDPELATKWFGHYGCGDPVHRAYDPGMILEATDKEWARIFSDSKTLIYSIYNPDLKHIGECQLRLDHDGSAELSLFIGPKDLWHHGYGTAAVMRVLDEAYSQVGLNSVWVNIPYDNLPAVGLFKKLGFVKKMIKEACTINERSFVKSQVMNMSSEVYSVRKQVNKPIISISGLPGSGSDLISQQVARLIGSRLLGNEIEDLICERLGCTLGELKRFQGGTGSVWTRFLDYIARPSSWSAGYDLGFNDLRTYVELDEDIIGGHITKEKYIDAVTAIFRSVAAEGDVVFNYHSSHLFVPPTVKSLNVFISASHEFRRFRVSNVEKLQSYDSKVSIEDMDETLMRLVRNLFNYDLLDMGNYDITLNLDRFSIEEAANLIVGSLGSPSLLDKLVNQDLSVELSPKIS